MRATSAIGCFSFLCSLSIVWIHIGYGLASITCTSTGELNSTCHRSGACYEEHSIPEQQEQCENKLLHINKTIFSPTYNITECDRGSTGFNRCNALKMDYLNPYLVRSLSYAVVPLDARHFSMDVSWTWYPEDFTRAREQLVGYELRISSDSPGRETTMKCLCIWDPLLRNFSLGFDPVLHYRTSAFNKKASMKITLFTLPYKDEWQPVKYSVEKDTFWPVTCQNLEITDATVFCPVALPTAPTGVNVLLRSSTNVTKELDVSWNSAAVASALSDTYYVTVYDNPGDITLKFVVNGSCSIKISGLHADTNYSLQIQMYSRCSGISSFYSNYSQNIGCGAWSQSTEESFQVSTTTSFPVSTNSTRYISSRNHNEILIACTGTLAALGMTSLLVILLSLSIFLYHKRQNNAVGVYPNPFQLLDPLSKLDALVLYSQGTPTSEQIEIEQYVVCLLKRDRLNVLSCNDHTEKTIVQWVEENARLAHTVFIVCNKHFCDEWDMQFRPPLINSLEMIIASAVGQKSIKKYATVLLKPSDEQYIPKHLYLKGMRSFMVGAHATASNRAEFVSFIKMQQLLGKRHS